MSVRLRDLVAQARAQGHDITLVAGADGLDHAVRWVHMVENEEIAGFLEGQEIAFTTGIGLESQEDLIGLVRSAYERGASGIVVNVGPFIRQISPETMRFCDEHGFPLFRVPWSEHMAQIMHRFSLSITLSEKHSMELAAALENAIFMPAREDLYLEYLEQNGFGKDWNYCVSVIEPCDADGNALPDELLEACAALADLEITGGQWQAASLTVDGRIVLVAARMDGAVTAEAARAVARSCGKVLPPGGHMYLGVGKVTRSARCIGKSYRQALALERLQWLHRKADEPSLYDDAGVDKLLLSVTDPEILLDYYDSTVGPLVEVDRLSHGDLTATLRTYLDTSGSIKETGERMFVHRNTVGYKLHRIEDLLGVDLSDFHDREELSLGLRVKELLDCMPASAGQPAGQAAGHPAGQSGDR